MQKDKIIKISLISIILFIVGIMIVSASNNISLKCTSDYEDFLVSENDKDIIDASYFNQNNMMLLDYKVLNGFSEIKESNLKVKLDGLDKYDDKMIDSCIRLFYEDGGVKSFKLALSYKNYLNYTSKVNVSESTGEMVFPDSFKIVLYSEIDEEEIVVLERIIQFSMKNDMNEVDLVIQPYDTSETEIKTVYSYLECMNDETFDIDVYTYSLGIGAWEDEKYAVFDYYLYDNSSPKNDLKSISSVRTFEYAAKDEELPGFSILIADNIDGSKFEGNPKLIFKYERPSVDAIDFKTYTYNLYFTDVNGKVTNAVLNINFKQYARIAYMPGLSNPELGETAVIKEKNSVLKASPEGTFDVVINTPMYKGTNAVILDSEFNMIDGDLYDIKSYSGRLECTFKNLETGWYNCEIYSNNTDKPSNIYSFYFEKEPLNSKTIMYYNGESRLVNPEEDINLTFKEVGDWILFDTSLFVGDREVSTNSYYSLKYLYDKSKFDENFSGALYVNTIDDLEFPFSLSKIGNDYDNYNLIITLDTESDLKVDLTSSQGYAYIPTKESDMSKVLLYPSIQKDGKEIEEEYSYKVYLDNKEISLQDISIVEGEESDIFYVYYGALEGEYIIKMFLDNHEDISASTKISLMYEDSEEGNSLILKILNDSEIAVPEQSGYKNKVYLEGRVIENGVQLNETGDFQLLTNIEGVSLSGSTLTVLSSAKIGESFDVKFVFRDKSITKTFTLVEQNDENDSGIVDEDDKPIGTEPVSSIILRGFDSDKLETKFLTFPDTSGESKTISYTCYDENGNAIQNPDLKISGSDISNGILVVPNYSNKTITIYANGLFNDREFYLDFVSNSKNILNQKVIACKPNTWECSLDFDNYQFIRNSSFSASGSFSSFFDTDTNVSLALVLYDSNNKIVKYNVDSQIVKPGETVDFKAKFLMPAEIDNITVKAFFINGTDITDSSKLYMTSKSITNSGEVY